MARTRRKICPEEVQMRFRMANAIVIVFLVASGIGVFFFVYHLIGGEIAEELDLPLYHIEGTNPPYVGIILVGVFILSWVLMHHLSKLEKSACF